MLPDVHILPCQKKRKDVHILQDLIGCMPRQKREKEKEQKKKKKCAFHQQILELELSTWN
jgi:hypothetical protein